MIHQLRVIFGDTDQMGVVYYANYLRYFESARGDYFRARGRSYKDVEARGLALPVVEAHCEYKRPAYYEDVLDIDIRVTELRAASCRFGYVVRRADTILALGHTRHAVIDSKGRPIALPEDIRASLVVEPF